MVMLSIAMPKMFKEEDIKLLDKIAEDFECELLLPPAKEIRNPFFDVTQLRHNAVGFGNFLIEIKKIGKITYDSIVMDSKIFIEIRYV